jgi:alkaline phosphatase
MAEENKLSTGLVATSSILHATPASFIAHQPNRYMYPEIAGDFVHSGIDLFIGGGRYYFEDSTHSNFSEKLRELDYSIVYDLDDIDPATTRKTGCLVADRDLPTISEGRGDYLPRATQIALEKLNQNENGFFVMIEASQIDWGGHDNDIQYILDETLDLDKAAGIAFDFADEHPGTLVIVTADHETGGLTLTGGNVNTGKVEAHFSTDSHTGVLVPVYAYGTGAEEFTGMYDNTELFQKMVKVLSFEKQ